MSIEKLIRYSEYKASEALIARDGQAFLRWRGRSKWLRYKVMLHKHDALAQVKAELEISVEENSRDVSKTYPALVDYRRRALEADLLLLNQIR